MNADVKRIQHLAQVLESYAKNDEEKRFVKNFTDGHQTTNAERILELTCAILDGLKYGNWPWVVARLNEPRLKLFSSKMREIPLKEEDRG